MRMRVLLSTAGILAVTAIVLAHPDDPKARTVVQPYHGPGYRAAEGGIAGETFPAEGVTLMSWVPFDEFNDFSGAGDSDANDCWGYVSPSGREYALMGLRNGTAIVEVTDPGDAQIIEYIPGPTSTWRDHKVYQEYAYAVSEAGQGIQVFDMTQVDSGVVTYMGDVTSGGTEATHNVALDETSGFLYRAGGGGNGIRIYDLSDPSEPEWVAEWSEHYVHDCQVHTYQDGPYADRQIAFLCGGANAGFAEPGLTILDVTDKQDIIHLSTIGYPQSGYAHQGWLSSDGKYFFLDDEFDEGSYEIDSTMIIVDVCDLENPSIVTNWTNGIEAVTHDLYVRGNLAFAANYTSGLRVFDVTDAEAPTEVAFFDTEPDNDGYGYNNLWSNFPLFPSGTIIGSDRERGLFVWRLDIEMPGGPDVNADGVIDVEDLVLIITNWGPCPPGPCPWDVDGDGVVGVPDLVEVILAWG